MHSKWLKAYSLIFDLCFDRASQVVLLVKSPPAKAGDAGDADLISGLGRSQGVRSGNSLQYSCLENSMDRETWWATPRGHRELDRTQQVEHLTGSSDIWQLSLLFSLPSHSTSRQKKATWSLNKTGSCGLHWISPKQTYRPILGEEEGQLISTNIPIYFSNSI